MPKRKILLVGGGTGGHFYPLIAIAESLRTQLPDIELYYAGNEAYDQAALSSVQASFVYIPAGKQRRYRSILNFFDVFKAAFGFCVALIRLYTLYPDVVISKGGYTSVPVVLAAAFLRIPIIVHESDSKMGRANRIAFRFATHVIVAYQELADTLNDQRVQVWGIPIRKSLLTPPSTNPLESFDIDPNRPLIFVIGGSQGAERVNHLILESLDELLPTYSIIHQTGKAHYDICAQTADRLIPDPELRKHYHPLSFLTEGQMNDAYHLAQVVVSRAGSTSLYEIALHGKPSIIIPIPEDISHDQRTNAYSYARTGAATVLEEKNLTDALLRSEIDRIMQDTAIYEAMASATQTFGRTDVADNMAALAIGIAQQH